VAVMSELARIVILLKNKKFCYEKM
jgi:hypothetical protein